MATQYVKPAGWGVIVNDAVNAITGGAVDKIKKKKRDNAAAGQDQTSALKTRIRPTSDRIPKTLRG